MDIPEFYALAEEIFTPEEAAVSIAMPRSSFTAGEIAQRMGKSEEEVGAILEDMANKGLCTSNLINGVRHYSAIPFAVGIIDYSFARGTSTERDRKIAGLAHSFKEAVDAVIGPPKINVPVNRVLAIEKSISADSKINTFDQVSSYISRYDPIAVATCPCRHNWKLLDEKKDLGKPTEICIQFGTGAEFVIERGFGRKVTKEEALQILRGAEEAGMVHATLNSQEIAFLCNCSSSHCRILQAALAQPKPGRALFSGFQPYFDHQKCISCETCIERCPASALKLVDLIPEVNMDRCFGCGLCTTGCPVEAVKMEERPQAPEPPLTREAFVAALAANR